MAIGVCIVEDDREIRELLSDLVLASGQFDFLGGFETAEDLMRAFRKLQPDVVLMDINLPGINQVNINERAGLTFPVALRAFLRQDPDIIFIGEIRDHETAQIATRAAMTGRSISPATCRRSRPPNAASPPPSPNKEIILPESSYGDIFSITPMMCCLSWWAILPARSATSAAAI